MLRNVPPRSACEITSKCNLFSSVYSTFWIWKRSESSIFSRLQINFWMFHLQLLVKQLQIAPWNGRRYQQVLALCDLLTGVILKGLTLRKCVFDVCVCMFCFMFTKWFFKFIFWTDLTKGLYIYEKSFEMCICLWPEFDCPEVALTLKSNY